MTTHDYNRDRQPFVPVVVRSFLVILLAAIVGYKIVVTPFSLQFDFTAFLTLLLALFSVGLAALFYFKATETSNRFYDNTYKFTQQIAELLVRIESGFGEKLEHLDEGYKSMRDRIETRPEVTIENTKKEIEEEEKELQKAIEERDKLIEQLATKAQLQTKDKKQFIQQLNKKDKALNDARKEISLLNNRLVEAQHARRHARSSRDGPQDIKPLSFLQKAFTKEFGSKFVINESTSRINRRFKEMKDSFPRPFISDMEEYDLIDVDGNLTIKTLTFLRNSQKRFSADE